MNNYSGGGRAKTGARRLGFASEIAVLRFVFPAAGGEPRSGPFRSPSGTAVIFARALSSELPSANLFAVPGIRPAHGSWEVGIVARGRRWDVDR